jgi:hypothetical protein
MSGGVARVPSQKTSAHLVQPIPGPAAVPEGLLLDPAPDLIDGVPTELDPGGRRRTGPPLPDQRPTSDPTVTNIALDLQRPPAHRLGAGSLPRSVDHRQAAEERASLRPEWGQDAPSKGPPKATAVSTASTQMSFQPA